MEIFIKFAVQTNLENPMETAFDFDIEINRRGTGAVKTDSLVEFFGCDGLEPLWVADMDFAVAPQISSALRERMRHPVYGYAGVPESFWESIIQWQKHRHGWEIKRDELTFVNGVVRGFGFILNFFTQQGDKILIQTPVYHPFRRLTEGNGRICVTNPLREVDGNYEMDFEDLERKFSTERPKLMVLCNPHNPIGIQWSREDMLKVASLAKRYGVKVISDEIHGDLMLWGKPHIPFLSVSDEAREVGIAMGAPSKTFNIPGLASSWIVISNPELRRPFYEWMTVNEFSDPTFVATVATEAAYRHGENWLDSLIGYLEGNIEAVERYCEEHLPGIRAIRPQASFLVWLDCRGLGLDHDGLIDLFVNRARLALNDGAMFGEEGCGFMRLNVASPRSVIMRSLDSLHMAAGL